MNVAIHALPSLVREEDLRDHVVIVIDALRASTTICTALANGAERVIACLSVDEAIGRADGISPKPLLGGERKGVLIDGFDLGNSPLEYERSVVEGRTVVFTTTNGTKAMLHAAAAHAVLVGAAVNLEAVANEAARIADEHQLSVACLCAGTDGEVTEEDIFVAVLIASALDKTFDLNHLEHIETDFLALPNMETISSSDKVLNCFLKSRGGKNLIALNKTADISYSSQLNTVPVVPVFQPSIQEIRLAATGKS
ncbi:2-phosphosulfolactate phosphatase [Calycomorphotria hydatis]|uniref:Probable 2-phosphosulfolactate phosphatase n=1 Tax=Calycomorphotria hydatis TaxID=2528027 RepID=A0A517T9A0_9PLAN|nr:2-phosphosulfolactate phosphatase [Calycomorphotria hydatis]QDT64964.1 putative 2-phosphosulfolactate phosphatase [Calycomorphotria hydatis]